MDCHETTGTDIHVLHRTNCNNFGHQTFHVAPSSGQNLNLSLGLWSDTCKSSDIPTCLSCTLYFVLISIR